MVMIPILEQLRECHSSIWSQHVDYIRLLQTSESIKPRPRECWIICLMGVVESS